MKWQISVEDSTEAHAKCMMQSAANADNHAKFRSSQPKGNQSIVETVTARRDPGDSNGLRA